MRGEPRVAGLMAPSIFRVRAPRGPVCGTDLAGVVALECLEAVEPSPGKRILINGASGGFGTFAIQLARALGLHVTAVVSPR